MIRGEEGAAVYEEGIREGREVGIKEGRKEERANTARERARADAAEARMAELEDPAALKKYL